MRNHHRGVEVAGLAAATPYDTKGAAVGQAAFIL